MVLSAPKARLNVTMLACAHLTWHTSSGEIERVKRLETQDSREGIENGVKRSIENVIASMPGGDNA